MPKFCLKKPVLGEKPLFESKMYAVGGSPIQDFALFWAFPYDDGDEDDCLEVCKMLLIPTFTARAQPFLIFPGPLHFFAKGISFQILNLREQRQDKHFIHRDVNCERKIFDGNADYENYESDGGSDYDPDLLLLQLRSFPENTCQSISVRTIHCRLYRL